MAKTKTPAARGRGRPSGYSAQVGAQIVAMVQQGASEEHAAGAVGINRKTFYGWLRDGVRLVKKAQRAGLTVTAPTEGPPADLAEFCLMVEKARSVAVVFHETRFTAAKDARVSWLWLRARHRTGWGDNPPVPEADLRRFEKEAEGIGTDLGAELLFARKRIAIVRGLIMQGGSDSSPLDKLLALEAQALVVLARLVRLQKDLNPGEEKSGDLRVTLELTGGAIDLGERAPNLEADAPKGTPAPRAEERPVVGGTGDPTWDDVAE